MSCKKQGISTTTPCPHSSCFLTDHNRLADQSRTAVVGCCPWSGGRTGGSWSREGAGSTVHGPGRGQVQGGRPPLLPWTEWQTPEDMTFPYTTFVVGNNLFHVDSQIVHEVLAFLNVLIWYSFCRTIANLLKQLVRQTRKFPPFYFFISKKQKKQYIT